MHTHTPPYNFTYAPAQPDVAAARADALALLEAPDAFPFTAVEGASLFAALTENEEDPAYGVDASDAEDIGIRPGCTVRILNSNPRYPLYARVKRILTNDWLRVEDLLVPAVTWKVRVNGVVVHMSKEAAEVGEVA